MKKYLLFALVFIGLASSGFTQFFNALPDQSRPPVFGGSPFQSLALAYDTTTNAEVYYIVPFVPGFTITGINGLTAHPHTGQFYCILKLSGVSGRVLATYDPTTAACTQIGNLGDNFATISFREDGQLFGVTGDGATVPETMYLIDHTNATKVVATTLGNGADGEVIAYNKDDDFFYHWSGNGTVVFEKIMSIPPYTVTGIPIIGSTNGETFGAVYLGGNKILISNIGSAFNRINTNGTWAPQFGSSSDDIRGLAIPLRWVDRPGEDTICSNDSSLFEAMGGVAYQWVKDGVNIPGATSSTYYANTTGWYNCRIILDSLYTNGQTMDSNITVYTDTAWYGRYLKVLNSPVVTITPTPNAYLCSPGDSVLLTGSAGGTSQWYLNGSLIPGATANTHYAGAPGAYNMIKTNLNGCSDSAAVGTTVLMAPTISLSPGADICYGDSVALITNAGASVYNWLESGTLFTTTSSETLYITSSGNYSVETNFGSCVDTSSTSIVNVAPQYNVTPNGSGNICQGTDIALNATPGGSSYQWLVGGVPISGANTDTYTAALSGNFSVIITFPGCTDTSITSFNLTVIDCSGIEENSTSSVIVYPNPATDFIRIKSDQEIQHIQITDMVGKIIQQKNINSIEPVININDLAPGVYLITIDTEKGTQSGRFVKE